MEMNERVCKRLKERHLTVGYRWPSHIYPNTIPYPQICIAGHYLGAFGFNTGEKYTALLEEGRIVITLDEPLQPVMSAAVVKANKAYRRKQGKIRHLGEVWKKHVAENV